MHKRAKFSHICVFLVEIDKNKIDHFQWAKGEVLANNKSLLYENSQFCACSAKNDYFAHILQKQAQIADNMLNLCMFCTK